MDLESTEGLHMNSNLAGRISYRVQGDWWVAYYALPTTMDGAIELGRVQMSIVTTNPVRKEAFMEIMRDYIAETIPAFEVVDAVSAPEHERSGSG